MFKGALLKRVFSFIGPFRYIFLGNLILAILLAFATPVRPYLIQLTVNISIGKQVDIPNWVHFFLPVSAFSQTVKLIIAITLFQVVFILIETIMRFFFSFGMAWLGQQVVRDLRNTVYELL